MDKLKILVVDDESRMRKLVRDFLIKKNFEVLEAGNERRPWISFWYGRHRVGDPGCDDAQNGRVADLQRDPRLFQGSDYYADSEIR